MTENVTTYFLKYKLIAVFSFFRLTSMAEFVAVSTSQSSSVTLNLIQFSRVLKNQDKNQKTR